MPQGYKYGIYDTVTKEYMPGPFQSKEVREIIGIKGSVAEQVKSDALFKGRYIVSIIGEWEAKKDDWSKEWDKARFRLLNARKKKK